MYLEQIEIIGFKSFADRTVIKFSKPITAIVGPNGCGKSNVVDAFRWVLGGPTAKSLRSEKMTDVIFSGTTQRKPLNYAQISLTFSKVKETLSLGFKEVCITRRLYRSGESEWSINRNPVRLKDVQKLLWEAGLGKNAFYIFEQGKIDELITSSPLERRVIFEEAAKVMHFKEKRKESLRKLAQVDANLKRILDIQGEVNKQIETLIKQAQEAEIYKQQKELLAKLSKELLIRKWQKNDSKNGQLEQELKQNEQAAGALKKQLKQLEQELKTHKEEHHLKSKQAKQAYEAFFEVKKTKELASFEYTSHKKKQDELFEQKSLLRKKLQEFHQKHLQEHKIYLENQEKLKHHSENLKVLSKDHTTSLSKVLSLEEQVQTKSALRKETQKVLLEVVNHETKLQLEFKNACAQLERAQERHNQITLQEKNYLEKLKESQSQLASFKSLQKELFSKHQDLETLLEQQASGLKEQQEHLTTKNEKLKVLSNQLNTTKSNVDLLQKLKDELDGYDSSAKKILQLSQDPSSPLFEKVTPIAEWITPLKGFEICVSALLGPYLQTLIVKKADDLDLTLKLAQSKNLQGFSILCLEHLNEPASTNEQKIAQPNPVANHFLSAVQEKEDFLKPLKPMTFIQKKFFFDQKKVLHNISSEKTNLFLREAELKENYKSLFLFEESHQKLCKEVEEKQTQVDLLQEQFIDTKEKKDKSKMSLVEVELKLEACLTRSTSLEEKYNESQSSHQGLKESLATLLDQKKALSCQFDEKKKRREEQEQTFHQIESQFEKNYHSLSETRSLKQSLENRIKGFEKEAQNLQESIKIFESKSEDFEEQIEKMNHDIEKNEQDYSALENQNHQFLEREKKLLESLTTAQTHYQSFEEALEKIELDQLQIEETMKQHRSDLEKNQQESLVTNNQISRFSGENDLLYSEIFEKYQLSVEEVRAMAIEASFSVQKTEQEIKKTRKHLESLGEINLKAVADCKEQQERFSFLQAQIEDLNASQGKLIEIITELDNESRKLFLETFENIRTHFRTNYALLFNGGEADLKLSAGEDVLDAGIDIIAQPPGKKMRSIHQLSGGEKCLTATALLFALFETQSIPFCILDEIDAPLDDTNVERFTKVLKQFVKNHQFIIITHNKRTMAMADILLGISMQEKGVTKVIPFEFNSQPEKEEPQPQAAL